MIDHAAADYCPTCGQPRDLGEAVQCLGLTLTPGGWLRYGERKDHLSPMQASILRAIMLRGSASYEFILLRSAPDSDYSLLYVHMVPIRRKLAALTSGELSIRTNFSNGYELVSTQAEAA